MIVDTSRFGKVEVDDDRIIHFDKGLLGFMDQKAYALIQPNDDSFFFWLQSVDVPELAFVVTDPTWFVPDYEVAMKKDQMSSLALADRADAQVLVVVNKRDTLLTGNLQGPLVINSLTRSAAQIVLSDQRYSTRMPLIDLETQSQAVSA